MKRVARFTCVLLLLLAASLPAFARRKNANVTIMNFSKWKIHELYLSESEQENWGVERLQGRIIATNGEFTLTNLACDIYDVRIVDEDGDECVIEQVELCNGRKTFRITDKDLLACEGYEEE